MDEQKQKRVYEVAIPVQEIWVYRVEATSKEEALELANAGKGAQIHSISGNKGYVVEVKEK